MTAYALWPKGNVRIIKGAKNLGSFSQTGQALRQHCKKCGGSVMTETTTLGLVDVYPVLLKGFRFTPKSHIYYGDRIIDMPDRLPKFRDMPARAGGSDEMIPD